MDFWRHVIGGRLRWALPFSVLLLCCMAVPVLAASLPPSDPSAGVEVSPPDAEDIAESIAQIKQEEGQRLALLKSPQAVRERKESETAYADLSATSAAELLSTRFSEQLEVLNSDPARFLSQAKLNMPRGEGVATVTSDGNTTLMESSVPVRVEDEGGDLSKVNLRLEATESGLQPANPIVTVTTPESAVEGVKLGEAGLTITQTGADADSSLHRFGNTDAFYPEIQESTDLLVSPTSTGVELFDQLRSADSPETLRFKLGDLPGGAELRPDEEGGAEVLVPGQRPLVRVPTPTAVDAQGTDVPVELQVEGDSLVLRVDHRKADFAHPILVDPIFVYENWDGNSWYNGLGIQALEDGTWQASNNAGAPIYFGTHPIYEDFGGSKRGLFLSVPNGNWASDLYGQFYYTVPHWGSYIDHAHLFPFWRTTHGCDANAYQAPWEYDGLWDGTQWIQLHYEDARNFASSNLPQWGKMLVVGLSTGWMNGSYLPCWRDLYVGGVGVWLDDWGPPTLDPPTGMPTGWINGTTPFYVNAHASDGEGLGISKITISPEGAPIIQDQVGCVGTRSSPCPSQRSHTFTLTGASFDEGEKKAQISAEDPTLKGSNSYSWTTKVDRTPPNVTLNGQLAVQTDETEGDSNDSTGVDPLRLPVYNLTIAATDGTDEKTLADRRSGVRSIEVYLDGLPDKSWMAGPCANSCPMTETYTLRMNQIIAAGPQHTLKIVVKDFADNKPRERNIEFEYIPATGMKDEYVMQYFPLPDGQGNEAEEEHPDRPELAVNVMNGNLVYREKDVEIEGPAVDLEVERFYNSQLPTTENTEWGDGWTLAQTPDLEPIDTGGSPAADEAELVDASGAIDEGVELPIEAEDSQFDPALQATLTKEADGGYELTDETGEASGTVVFDQNGRAEEMRAGDYAKVDYGYEGGELSEIAVDDPASTNLTPPPPPPIEEEPGGGEPTYQSSFGTAGGGNGQFNHPADVARDPKGNLLVVDSYNSRIERFTAAGEYLAKFGSEGSGNGQLDHPAALAVDAKGNIWVADTYNNRIEQFNEKGEFLLKKGTSGTGNGAFSGPEGIAVDAKGNIWVSDTGNGRVQKFNEKGEFLKVVGSKGSGSGQLGKPTGIDIAPDSSVWIADRSNNRVSVFNEAGTFVRQFGSLGSDDGEFTHPTTIDVDTSGNVWVGEENDRFQQFDEEGKYVAQFGSSGSGPGQFSFSYPMGLTTDSEGNIWITDTENDRVQRWSGSSSPPPPPPIEEEPGGGEPTYQSSFGTAGSGNGQFNHPADVARDPKGNLLVVDSYNSRIERFTAAGEYLAKFGSEGSGNGQLDHPAALAVDAKGNIWVADTYNNRIEQFNEKGEFLLKKGTSGSGNGAFSGPEGIAVDAKGNIWVADTGNGRVQKFNEKGEFLKVVGSKGSGSGQLGKPTGIDIAPDGSAWIADRSNNRVSVFNEAGTFEFQFGSLGSDDGEFTHPTTIDVDGDGNVWVGEENDRFQQFDEEGKYVAQFGSSGSGPGQFSFSYPMGLTTDSEGNIWITDTENDRVQRWQGEEEPEEEELPELPVQDDPMVEVEVDDGLVSGLEGEESGEHSYAYVGDDLVSHDGPQGETEYEYDSAGRMTKVTLSNGTTGAITYNTTYGRVSSVTVDPAGSEPAKTTYFEYSDDPRRTTVVPDAAPVTTYDIGADGSVLKWWNSIVPPDFDDLAGSLYANKETATPITTGDHNLVVQAHSQEGVASIEVVANGNQLVDDKSCEQDFEKPGIECITLINEWVTETGSWPPGVVYLEVIITDRLGGAASERFWVNIPYTPPPDPEMAEAPKFNNILHFREEFGLDLDLDPVDDELTLDDRVWDLIGAWYNPQTPLGEVARASWERWGVPLRPVDVAELEYREWFYSLDADRIDQWVEETEPSSFAGYYIDHAAGGIMHIGFTDMQAEHLASLRASLSLVAGERLQVYQTTPTASYLSVRADLGSVSNVVESNSILDELVVSVDFDESGKAVRVGTPSVAQVKGILDEVLGPNAAVVVEYETGGGDVLSGRFRNQGRMRAGDFITSRFYSGGVHVANQDCTAGFGAKANAGEVRGKPIWDLFVLTAGHCTQGLFGAVYRSTDSNSKNEDNWKEVGTVTRDAFAYFDPVRTDAEAIEVHSEGIVPQGIFGSGGELIGTEPATTARIGDVVCYSGAKSQGSSCGQIVARSTRWTGGGDGAARGGYWVEFNEPRPGHGDSGAPVWDVTTGASIGLVTAGRPHIAYTETLVEPLLHPPHLDGVPGILNNPHMGPLSLKLGG